MFGRNLQDLTIELNSRASQLNFFSVAVKVQLSLTFQELGVRIQTSSIDPTQERGHSNELSYLNLTFELSCGPPLTRGSLDRRCYGRTLLPL
jgi:hypothetical protein